MSTTWWLQAGNIVGDPYSDKNFGHKCSVCGQPVVVPELFDPENHPLRMHAKVVQPPIQTAKGPIKRIICDRCLPVYQKLKEQNE